MSLLRPHDFDLFVPAPVQPSLYANRFKRLLDVIGSAFLLVLTGPIILTVMGIVALDGHSPIYTQDRVGRNGRRFRMLKIRSMVPDSAGVLARYLERNVAAKIEWDATQKLRRDPRITRIGRMIRKTSIDELPQLWNVLRGDLSLVGPRPLMPEQVNMYPGICYFGATPGLTGLWQVEGRSNTAMSARAWFDQRYAAHVTFGTDLAILFKTVGSVVRGTGC